jgi:hypothetical protein
MTILEAINRTDRIKPNTYSNSGKVRWLSNLDGVVKREIIDTHEGGEDVRFEGYNDETLLATELLIPAPYDEVYIRYLEMQIDYANGEYGKYNNSTIAYNTAFSAFERYYNREHMPKSHGTRFLF